MKNLMMYFALAILAIACDDEKDVTPAGTYEGVFYRTISDVKLAEASVSLTFSPQGFTGNSDTLQYPAICLGTFEKQGTSMTFTNGCAWTAQFDWSFILAGDFAMQEDGKSLTLIRNHGDGVIDTYELTRQ